MKTQPKPKIAERASGRRDGVTIIEVLTSLLVASIGVFGVLILIPFAVQQAQIGLDQDAADLVGRNAFEDLQIYGYTSVNDLGQFRIGLNGVGISSKTPSIFHLDPLSFQQTAVPPNQVDFLDDQIPSIPSVFRLNRLNALTTRGLTPSALSAAEANRIFRTDDDIVIGDTNFISPATEPSDLDLPQPVFDLDGGGDILRRQSLGRISWSAIYVPFKDTNRVKVAEDPNNPNLTPASPATGYKIYILVYKDRNLEVTAPAVSVLRRASSEPNPNAGHGGYVSAIDQILLTPDPSQNLDPPNDPLNPNPIDPNPAPLGKDDWVMLINRKPPPDYTNFPGLGIINIPVTDSDGNNVIRAFDAEEIGYDVQLGFAKVIAVDRDNGRLTVNGGAFDFYFTDVPNTETYVVNLRDVVNVYERTITLERNSVWSN